LVARTLRGEGEHLLKKVGICIGLRKRGERDGKFDSRDVERKKK